MAVYRLPPDRRWEQMGQSLGSGLTQALMMKLQQQIQQENMGERAGLLDDQRNADFEKSKELERLRTENAKSNDAWKREQTMNQARAMFQPQEAHVPNAQGQNPLMVDPMFTPQNTGLNEQMLNRMQMGMMGGFNPQSMMPTVQKPAGMQFHNGVTFDPNTGNKSGTPYPKEFAPSKTTDKGFAPKETQVLIQDLQKMEKGTQEYALTLARLKYLTERPMSAMDKYFMSLYPEAFQGTEGNTTTPTNTLDVNNFFDNE